MRLTIIIEETGASTIAPKDVNEAVRKELHGAGEYWHKNFRKRHFHSSAFTYYRYTPRKKRYQWKKLRRGLGNNPLVFTGISKRLSEGKTIRATPSKVDVVMPTRAFNFKAKGSQVDMRDEFTQINEQEHAEIDSRMEAGLTKTLMGWKGKRTTRIRDSTGRFIKG
jgi:hypothetical protein